MGPLHGYGVARRLEQVSGDYLAMNEARSTRQRLDAGTPLSIGPAPLGLAEPVFQRAAALVSVTSRCGCPAISPPRHLDAADDGDAVRIVA
jgi:hypothetical protein